MDENEPQYLNMLQEDASRVLLQALGKKVDELIKLPSYVVCTNLIRTKRLVVNQNFNSKV